MFGSFLPSLGHTKNASDGEHRSQKTHHGEDDRCSTGGNHREIDRDQQQIPRSTSTFDY
jgi:hypothetical protein